VERYKRNQLAIIQERGHPVILGDFVCARLYNKLYLIDGHHRFEMLRQLRNIIDKNSLVQIQIFECKDDKEVNRLYEMANDRYTVNGNINEEGNVYDQGDKALQVVEQLKLHFNNFKFQSKIRTSMKKIYAPEFDINDLLSQLNQNRELKRLSVDEIVRLIVDRNREYKQEIPLDKRDKYKDGFYLCYGHTNCKWVEKLLK
jgi:hypothetical protein